jgi:hypothetical protein
LHAFAQVIFKAAKFLVAPVAVYLRLYARADKFVIMGIITAGVTFASLGLFKSSVSPAHLPTLHHTGFVYSVLCLHPWPPCVGIANAILAHVFISGRTHA